MKSSANHLKWTENIYHSPENHLKIICKSPESMIVTILTFNICLLSAQETAIQSLLFYMLCKVAIINIKEDCANHMTLLCTAIKRLNRWLRKIFYAANHLKVSLRLSKIMTWLSSTPGDHLIIHGKIILCNNPIGMINQHVFVLRHAFCSTQRF